MTVQVHGAKPGEHVLLNQNWDPGWSANGSRAIDWADLPAAEIHEPDETIVFRFRPRTWWLSLGVFALTVGGTVWMWRRQRRLARQKEIAAQLAVAGGVVGVTR